jgi:hypothetical protein
MAASPGHPLDRDRFAAADHDAREAADMPRMRAGTGLASVGPSPVQTAATTGRAMTSVDQKKEVTGSDRPRRPRRLGLGGQQSVLPGRARAARLRAGHGAERGGPSRRVRRRRQAGIPDRPRPGDDGRHARWPSRRRTGLPCGRSTQAALAAGGRDNGPACARSTTPPAPGPSCSIPTATTSRRSAISRNDAPRASMARGGTFPDSMTLLANSRRMGRPPSLQGSAATSAASKGRAQQRPAVARVFRPGGLGRRRASQMRSPAPPSRRIRPTWRGFVASAVQRASR